mmetsp:Transcript_26037/g.21932  ORF Transcript_26037/g.21932 Transcript_26037/m.21932 type:complete len:122 (-) Transcript_26037:257-622(-)
MNNIYRKNKQIFKFNKNNSKYLQVNDIMEFLNLTKIELDSYERETIIHNIIETSFKEGEKIITKDDEENSFYVLKSGSAEAKNNDGTVVLTYSPGMWFGELAAIYNQKRAIDIVAGGPVVV